MTAPTRIAVAVIESNGCLLVGIRPEGRPLAGYHEFPGGKCLADETPRSCLVRECQEETGLMVVPREHLITTTHDYPHGTMELHFWKCALAPDLPDCANVRPPFSWVSLSELPSLRFPEGNRGVLSLLLTSSCQLPSSGE